MAYHVDHVFPQKLFKNELKQYRSSCDLLSNLTLLSAQENIEKNSKPFEEWIQTREPAFLERHLIPQDKQLWRIESFAEFVEERRRLILARLNEVLKAE